MNTLILSLANYFSMFDRTMTIYKQYAKK